MKTNFDLVKDRSVLMDGDSMGDSMIMPYKIFPTVKDFVDFLNLPISILDEDEKRYIKNIVRPFRNDVTYITKQSIKDWNSDSYKIYEYLTIEVNEMGNIKGHIHLPCFVPNTMYKGMERDKNYTLEELGISFKN